MKMKGLSRTVTVSPLILKQRSVWKLPPKAGWCNCILDSPGNSKLATHMLLNERNGKLVCSLIVHLSFLLPTVQLNNTL